MARFLPALVACRDWRMHAVVRTRRRGWNVSLDLSSADGLSSHLPAPAEFDSSVEEAFAAKWGAEKRDGWLLVREGEILHQKQKVFVPDFVFRHDDGRTALMEIVGFWTPEYLQAKLETLRTFQQHRILLAVARPAAKAVAQDGIVSALPGEVIPYKTALLLDDVLERLTRISRHGGADIPVCPPKTRHWRALLDSAVREEEVRDLREHGRTGRPLGCASFLDRLETMVGRVLRLRKGGRNRALQGVETSLPQQHECRERHCHNARVQYGSFVQLGDQQAKWRII